MHRSADGWKAFMTFDAHIKRIVRGGCIGAVILSLITVPLLVLFLHFIGFDLDTDTTKRTPLSNSPAPTSLFRDAGDAITDPQELSAAMSEFYQQTGVAPFLYIMPEDSIIYRSIASSYESLYGPTLPQKERTFFTVVYSAQSQGGYDIQQGAARIQRSRARNAPEEIQGHEPRNVRATPQECAKGAKGTSQIAHRRRSCVQKDHSSVRFGTSLSHLSHAPFDVTPWRATGGGLPFP